MPEFTYKNQKGETVDLRTVVSDKDMWQADNGKVNILSLVGYQKIAEKEKIVIKEFLMVVTPTADNLQQHGCCISVGYKGDSDRDNWGFATGEASQLNTGESAMGADGKKHYQEWNKIDSKYRLAMSEKRAYVRAITKLIHLYGVYGEVESCDFSRPITNFDY